MVEPAAFEELDRAIGAVLDAETTDFFELAAMLGLNPKQDFAGADLSGTDLSRGDLSFADFTGTNFRGANLGSANLQGAILKNADLSFANLSSVEIKANRDRARRPRAFVRARRLRDIGRDIGRAFARGILLTLTFNGADLSRADLSGARVEGAIMTGCQGLSPSDIASLKERGAIFEDAPGDYAEIDSPRPKVPR